MRQGHGSRGGRALRALAVTQPSPGSVGATGERRGPAAVPCRAEHSPLSGTPVAAGAPRCRGRAGLGFPLHLPRKLNQRVPPLLRGLPLQQAARLALALPRGSWGPEGPSKVSSSRHPAPAPEDWASPLTLTASTQDAGADAALAHTGGTTEINMGRGWRGQAPARGQSPSPAPAPAQPRSSPGGVGWLWRWCFPRSCRSRRGV